MARSNKFAAQNLNDIYGKKEPKPTPADNGNPAGSRGRGSTHGGMLVLRPPVKQQPLQLPLKDIKTNPPALAASASTSALKKEAAEAPLVAPTIQAQNPLVSSSNDSNPLSSSSLNDSTVINNNNKQELPEIAGLNQGRHKPAAIATVTATAAAPVPSVENSKAEPADTISLRPNRRPDAYTPPAARTLAVPQVENDAEKSENAQNLTTAVTSVLSEPPHPVQEKTVENLKEEAVPAAAEALKPSRPEPFRPPQLRGDAARRLEPTISGGSSYPPPPREDLNPGRGWDNRGIPFQPKGRREEEGRYLREVPPPPPPQRRYDREERGEYFNREGNSYSSVHSRSAPEGRNYDIEVIRPSSGGTDRYGGDNNNSRDFAYGGRQGFDRRMMSPPPYGPGNPYWGEGPANYDSYEHRQDFNRQDGAYRRNYNSNNNHFKPGGMNRDYQNRDGYGVGRDSGGQRREPYGRNGPFGPGQFRDNFTAQVPVNGRFSGQLREQDGNFRQCSRMQRNGPTGGNRYNDPARGFGGDSYQRPRSGGYDRVSPRPRSSGRSMGSSDSMVGRPNFYNGRRSPISREKVGHEDFGHHGRYQYDGPMPRMDEMQNVDVGYQRPRSGGYGGHNVGRSMTSSDNMMSRYNNYNGQRSAVSPDKMDSKNISSRTQEQYHLEGSFSTANEVQGLDFPLNRLDNSVDSFNEFDSYRMRQEIHKEESNVAEEHQKMGWDVSMDYNVLNLESSVKSGGNEEVLVKSDCRRDAEQKVYMEDKREQKRIDYAMKEIVEQDPHAKGIPVHKRPDCFEQETREEVTEVPINRDSILESIDPLSVIHDTSGQFDEQYIPPNINPGLQEQEKLVDRLASSRITTGRNHRPVQNNYASHIRPPNYHTGRDVGPQPNSYASRSSAMSWRREPSEIRNGSSRRISSQHGDNSYRSQSREPSSSDRYQF